MVARDVIDKVTATPTFDHSGAVGEVQAQMKSFAPSPLKHGETPQTLNLSHNHPVVQVAQNDGPGGIKSDAPPVGITPSGRGSDTTPPPGTKQQQYGEDGFPIGGRPNDDYKWQKYDEADKWSADLQGRSDLNEHEKFAAGRMGLQLRRRASDPNRDAAAYTDTPDQRIATANQTLREWNQDMHTLQGKLSPDQAKLATKVQGELETELKQEEWRKKRFSQ